MSIVDPAKGGADGTLVVSIVAVGKPTVAEFVAEDGQEVVFIEEAFSVQVKSVNTLRVRGKWRVRGRSIGRSQPWKKAMVVLEEGQPIDLL